MHVHDGRKNTLQEDDSASSPGVPTLGSSRDSRPTSVNSRESDVRLGRNRVLEGREVASIKEPISLSRAPIVVDFKRTRATWHTNVKKLRKPDSGLNSRRKTHSKGGVGRRHWSCRVDFHTTRLTAGDEAGPDRRRQRLKGMGKEPAWCFLEISTSTKSEDEEPYGGDAVGNGRESEIAKYNGKWDTQ